MGSKTTFNLFKCAYFVHAGSIGTFWINTSIFLPALMHIKEIADNFFFQNLVIGTGRSGVSILTHDINKTH